MYIKNDNATLELSSEFLLRLSHIQKKKLIEDIKNTGFQTVTILAVNQLEVPFDIDAIYIFSDDNKIPEKFYNEKTIVSVEKNIADLDDFQNFKIRVCIDDSFEWLERVGSRNRFCILDFKPFKITSDNLNKYNILCRKINKIEGIFLSIDNWQTLTVKEHPCNLFACSGANCHSRKNNIVRNIKIDQNGNIFPNICDYEEFKLGNYNDDGFSKILTQNNYPELIKEIFREIIFDYPYDYIPLPSYFARKMEVLMHDNLVETCNFIN